MSESSMTPPSETLRPEKDPQIFEAVEQMARGLQAGLGQLAETAGRSAHQSLARHLIQSLAHLDEQQTQGDLLTAFLEEARKYASRAAFFLAKPNGMSCWSAVGFGEVTLTGQEINFSSATDWADLASGVVHLDADGCRVLSDRAEASSAVQGVLIPFVLRGQLSGALYADHLAGDSPLSVELLQILTHVASQELETLTVRAAVLSPTLQGGSALETSTQASTLVESAAAPASEPAPVLETVEAEASPAEGEPEPIASEPMAEETEPATDPEKGVAGAVIAAGAAAAAVATAGALAEDDSEIAEPAAQASTFETTAVPEASVAEASVAEASAAEADATPSFEPPSFEAPTFEAPAVTGASAVDTVDAVEASGDEQPTFETVEGSVEPAPISEMDLADQADTSSTPSFDPAAIEVDDSVLAAPPAEAAAVEPTFEVPAVEPAFESTVTPVEETLVAEAPAIEFDHAASTLDSPDQAPSFGTVPEFDTAATPVYTPEPSALEEPAPEIEVSQEPDKDLDDTASSLWDLEEDDEDVTAVTSVQPPPEPEAPLVSPLAASESPTAPSFAVPSDAIGQQTVRLNVAALQQGGLATPAEPPVVEEPPPASPPWASESAESASEDPTLMVSRSEVLPSPPSSAVEPPPAVAPPPAVEPPASTAVTPPAASGGSSEVRPPEDVQGPGSAFGGGFGQVPEGEAALHQEARRLARLLVSEIKLYNEDVIEAGRRDGNIYDRLKDDIDRSRQMYDDRIDERIRRSEDYFHQELVQRLAGGNSALLGI